MSLRVSRRMVVVFVVLLLTSIIATSVAAMGSRCAKPSGRARRKSCARWGATSWMSCAPVE